MFEGKLLGDKEYVKEYCYDITPVNQDEDPICQINYTKSCSEAMGYLHAIMNSNEYSERALQLTTICLKYNPANYTVWHFRRSILSFLSMNNNDDMRGKEIYDSTSEIITQYDLKFVKDEMDLASKLGGLNPKNYQIWYHRRSLLEYYCVNNIHTEYIQSELNYITTVLNEDEKNYHAWSNRQWIVTMVNQNSIWINEKVFVHEKISQDCRNNSAWNYLWFLNYHDVTKGTADKTQNKISPKDINLAKEEIDYALSIAFTDIYNESPWRYILSVLKRVNSLDLISKYLNKITRIKNDSHWSLEEKVGGNANNNSLSTLNTCNVVSVELLSSKVELWEMTKTNEGYKNAAELAHELGVIHDTIMNKYWQWKVKDLLSKIKI